MTMKCPRILLICMAISAAGCNNMSQPTSPQAAGVFGSPGIFGSQDEIGFVCQDRESGDTALPKLTVKTVTPAAGGASTVDFDIDARSFNFIHGDPCGSLHITDFSMKREECALNADQLPVCEGAQVQVQCADDVNNSNSSTPLFERLRFEVRTVQIADVPAGYDQLWYVPVIQVNDKIGVSLGDIKPYQGAYPTDRAKLTDETGTGCASVVLPWYGY